MNDSDKTVKILGEIQQQLGTMLQNISNLNQGQTQAATAIEAIAEGQNDIREQMAIKVDTATKDDVKTIRSDMVTKDDISEMATKDDIKAIRSDMATKKDLERLATKADIMDLRSDLTKKVKGHERRINTIEDELDLPHPHKN